MKQIDYTPKVIKNAIIFLMLGVLPSEMHRITKFRFRNQFLSKHFLKITSSFRVCAVAEESSFNVGSFFSFPFM